MTRTRASAKAAGTRFETLIATYLAQQLDEPIERRARNGARDRGDIAGLRTADGRRIVLECKDTARIDLAGWAREVATEVENDGAAVGLIVHKRHGNAQAEDQWVTCTLGTLAELLRGERP